MAFFNRVKRKLFGGNEHKFSLVDNGDVEGGPKKAPPKKDDISHLDLQKTSWAGALKITKSLLPYFWPRNDTALRLRVVLCILLIIIARVINVYVPIMYKHALDALPEVFPFWTIFNYGVLLLVQKSLGDLRDTIFQNVSQEATRIISVQTFSHIHRLSLSFHLSKKTGTLLKVVERGTNSVTTLLTLLLFNIAPTIIELIVVCIVLLVGYGVWLSFVAFAATVSYIVFTLLITEWRTKFRRAANLKENEANDICVDSMTNFETIKYFTAEEHERERYNVALKAYFDISLKSRFSLTLLNFGQGAITTVAVTIAMLISARLVYNGGDIGDVVAVNAYILQLFTPLGWLGTSYRMIMQSFTDMEKLIELLETEPDVKEVKNAQELTLYASPSVEFRNVQFAYGDAPLLKGISFSVEPGRSVALVGHSGSGKTTIFRLLCRFYDPQGGKIYIDGQDISTLTQDSLRSAIGVVPQDTVLFNDTIEYNIGFGNRRAPKEDIVAAAKGAQIFDFIQRASEGWKTIVGERGLRLSGGEKQRVAIARTILKNPPILVLDEATSALDSTTEKEIQKALLEVSKGRTTLVIAHRLSTIVNCDEILVLRNGDIKERGTHQSLLSSNGEYASMWYQQLKQEQELQEKSAAPRSSSPALIDSHSGLISPPINASSSSSPSFPPSSGGGEGSSGSSRGRGGRKGHSVANDEFITAMRSPALPPTTIPFLPPPTHSPPSLPLHLPPPSSSPAPFIPLHPPPGHSPPPSYPHTTHPPRPSPGQSTSGTRDATNDDVITLPNTNPNNNPPPPAAGNNLKGSQEMFDFSIE